MKNSPKQCTFSGNPGTASIILCLCNLWTSCWCHSKVFSHSPLLWLALSFVVGQPKSSITKWYWTSFNLVYRVNWWYQITIHDSNPERKPTNNSKRSWDQWNMWSDSKGYFKCTLLSCYTRFQSPCCTFYNEGEIKWPTCFLPNFYNTLTTAAAGAAAVGVYFIIHQSKRLKEICTHTWTNKLYRKKITEFKSLA